MTGRETGSEVTGTCEQLPLSYFGMRGEPRERLCVGRRRSRCASVLRNIHDRWCINERRINAACGAARIARCIDLTGVRNGVEAKQMLRAEMDKR